ncbi:MAG: hypothetical protein ACLQVI_26120 [Polyangiaceae bacterium]
MKEKRSNRFELVLSDRERATLTSLAELEGVDRADILRKGLRLVERDARPAALAEAKVAGGSR